jgi:hypothetical protein
VYDDQRSGVAKAVRKSWQSQFGGVWKAVKANEPEAKSLPDDHPLVARLLRASPTQSGATFRYEQIVQIGLTGGCLIWNVPNRAGFTCERYVIPTAVAQPVQATRDLPRGGYYISQSAVRRFQASMVDEQGFVEMSGYFAAIGQVIPMEQLQRVGWPHPIYKDDFQSSVSAAAVWNDTADMTDKSRWSQLKNGPNSSLAISPGADVELTPEMADQAAAKLAQKYCGAENHGKPFILPNGSTVTGLTTTPRDMVYGEAFEQFRDSLMAIHGVAPQAAGITLEGGYANFVAAIKQTTMLALQPVLDLIAAEDTAQLAPKYGPGLTVEYEAPNIDDPQQIESMLATDGTYGLRTVNEGRALRGLPWVPWGERPMSATGAAPGAAAGTGLPGDSSLVHGDQKQQGGSFLGVGRRDYQNSRKARMEVLDDFAEGAVSETMAIEELIQLGMPKDAAQRLIDAVKGVGQETPAEQEPAVNRVNRVGKLLNGNGKFHIEGSRFKDCGTGAGGFESGNSCAAGGGGGGGFSYSNRSPRSDHAAAVLDQWTTPATGSRQGEYDEVRKRGEAWVKGGKDQGFDDLYTETQQTLKEKGVKELKVYRGVDLPHDHPLAQAVMSGKIKEGSTIEASGMAISSWSDKQGVANQFADSVSMRAERAAGKRQSVGIVLERVVEPEHVVSGYMAHSGFLQGENEIVAMNPGKVKVRVVSVHGARPKTYRPRADGESFDLSTTDNQRGIEKPPHGSDDEAKCQSCGEGLHGVAKLNGHASHNGNGHSNGEVWLDQAVRRGWEG